MKSQFISRVSVLMLQGLTSPSEIYEIIKPEYDKKGSVVTYHNVVSAMSCVSNGWYTGDTQEKSNVDID